MKKLCLILAGALMISMLSGCRIRSIEEDFISDGDFKYYYIEDRDCYAIVGSNFQEPRENLYIPTHFRGKKVEYTKYYKVGYYFGHTTYYLNAEDVTNLYLPYTFKVKFDNYVERVYIGYPQKTFFANSEDHFAVAYTLQFSQEKTIGYVTEKLFEKSEQTFSKERNCQEKIGGYVLKFRYESNTQITMQKANTSYMFNYEGSPNEGYFFINDFERGGEIEDTPYEPTREGYTFGGWYKEPECKNAWDFGADTLPEAEYDEEGVLIFKETQLYAKWIKN